ncbi:MAG: DUF6967 family protein [Betaproteobacteria bacterium]
MDGIVPVARLKVPLGGQLIELQHVAHEGGMPMLRIRIREGHRFTVLDIDPRTAGELACAMQAWARTREEQGEASP